MSDSTRLLYIAVAMASFLHSLGDAMGDNSGLVSSNLPPEENGTPLSDVMTGESTSPSNLPLPSAEHGWRPMLCAFREEDAPDGPVRQIWCSYPISGYLIQSQSGELRKLPDITPILTSQGHLGTSIEDIDPRGAERQKRAISFGIKGLSSVLKPIAREAIDTGVTIGIEAASSASSPVLHQSHHAGIYPSHPGYAYPPPIPLAPKTGMDTLGAHAVKSSPDYVIVKALTQPIQDVVSLFGGQIGHRGSLMCSFYPSSCPSLRRSRRSAKNKKSSYSHKPQKFHTKTVDRLLSIGNKAIQYGVENAEGIARLTSGQIGFQPQIAQLHPYAQHMPPYMPPAYAYPPPMPPMYG